MSDHMDRIPRPAEPELDLLHAEQEGMFEGVDRVGIGRAVFAVAAAWGAVGALAVACFLLGRATEPTPAPEVYVVTSTTSASVQP